jgi:predicted DNA-binding protein (UPF0251 family)
MARPLCPRRVAAPPPVAYFKPAGVPLRELVEVELTLDEFEALRLADLDGLYQADGARKMGVSRATFARILEASRRKVAEALVSGRALRIGGGPVTFPGERRFRCETCRHEWTEPFGTGRPGGCSACGSTDFRRTDPGPRGPQPARVTQPKSRRRE